jgi:hypothetical protein
MRVRAAGDGSRTRGGVPRRAGGTCIAPAEGAAAVRAGVLGRSAARGPATSPGASGAVASSRRPSLGLVAVAGGAAGAGGWRPPDLAPAWAGARARGGGAASRGPGAARPWPADTSPPGRPARPAAAPAARAESSELGIGRPVPASAATRPRLIAPRTPRPPPAWAAAGPPGPARRGRPRAASRRLACLFIHIITMPEIPDFPGFSSRQAR